MMEEKELQELFALYHDLVKNFLYEVRHIPVYGNHEGKTVRNEITCISDAELFVILKEAMSKYNSTICRLLFSAATALEWIVKQSDNNEEFTQLYGFKHDTVDHFKALIADYRSVLKESRISYTEIGYGQDYFPIKTTPSPRKLHA